MTQDEYDAWLEDPTAQRVTLIEAEVMVNGVETMRYMSFGGYVSFPTDTPPNQSYDPILTMGFPYSQSLSLTAGGSAGLTSGDIEISNPGGVRDAWVLHIWNNRPIRAWHGDTRWPRAAFKQIFDGVGGGIAPKDDGLTLKISDKLQRLNTPVTETKVGGNAPNPDDVVRITIGEGHNITPQSTDPATLEYSVMGGAVGNISEVRVAGRRVAFTKRNQVGKFNLLTTAAGTVTASIQGDALVGGADHPMPVLFAGSAQASNHFVAGSAPDRGIDVFALNLANVFGKPLSLIVPVNGALSSSAADRAGAVDTKGDGYWWDLENGAPGPAFAHCLAQVGAYAPQAVIWAQGDQDAAAIRYLHERLPRPTVDRTKLATLAVFDHMRALWGKDVQIFIQQQAWSWTASDLTATPGTAVYLRAVGSAWGDARLSWLVYQADPTGLTFTVEILDPTGNTDNIIRSLPASGARMIGGTVCLDYPVEMSVPDFGFPATYLRWRVRTDSTGAVSKILNNFVEVDNSFVKKTVMFGGQSNAFAHFSTLSGTENRRDLVSAAEFRRSLAAQLGLSAIEVMPINVSLGSSAADKLAAEGQGSNYWWDLDGRVPGPRLNDLIATMQQAGVKPDIMIWAQGEADVTATQALAAPLYSNSARYRAATEAVFNYIRTALGVPTMPIWLQMLGRAYWGYDPIEVVGAGYKAYRDAQRALANADPYTQVGSWLPGADSAAGYVEEVIAPGWIHYTWTVYHAVAIELATAIATGHDRVNEAPAWTKLSALKTFTAVRSSTNQDILMSWSTPDAPASGTHLVNMNISTNAVISDQIVGGTSLVFTEAQQNAVYGQRTGYVYVAISARLDDGMVGPATTFVKKVKEIS